MSSVEFLRPQHLEAPLAAALAASWGIVAQPGLSEDLVAGDLTVVGSLWGGGDLGSVDLIYVPEPAALSWLLPGWCVSPLL